MEQKIVGPKARNFGSPWFPLNNCTLQRQYTKSRGYGFGIEGKNDEKDSIKARKIECYTIQIVVKSEIRAVYEGGAYDENGSKTGSGKIT